MIITRLKRLLVGEPLSMQFAHNERIPKWKALSTLSSDALSSVAYATDAILLALVGFSTAAVIWSIPIAIAIAVLLVIITASYFQTIESYPGGGGAYTVAKENLGQNWGLVAGAALLIDYILTVSVSVASGIENIGSAWPMMNEHKEIFGAIVIIIIMVLNLRGIRESATIFAFPTYFFIFSIFIMLGVGAWKIMHGDAVAAQPLVHAAYPAVPMILVLRAFASGCSALTGVEAISNGVAVFQQPSSKNAKTTLLWMSTILAALFLGITSLAHIYGLVPTETETLISMLGTAIFGKTFFYYSVQVATALILFLAANTSYADFPRLASLLARDRYLPRQLASVGDRLVFSNGVLGLSVVAIVLLVIFKGTTNNLIPLYAIGVFLSFTLSQSGMVIHHLKEKQAGWVHSLILNGLGALTTLIVLLDIASSKFLSGAWMVIIMIPILILIFLRIHKHYLAVGKELSLIGQTPDPTFAPIRHTVIIPISGIHRGVLEALRYALSISPDVRACYVELDPEATERVKTEWAKWAPQVPFVVLKSPYRSVVQPLINYIDDVEEVSHDDMITIVVPEFVTAKWWHRLLHNQTAIFIRAALMFKKGKVVTSVRYHLRGV